jgi:exosortase A
MVYQRRTAATIVILSCVGVLAVLWETTASMVTVWAQSSTFAHGFLILPVSMWLTWRRRHQIESLVVAPNLWGLVILATLGCGWLIGKIADVLLVQHIALVLILQVLIWTALGPEITRALLFPIAFLFFAVPVGESLVAPLQDFTAFFAVTGLRLSQVPVLWEGRFITTPGHAWEVAEACSAIRYVIPAAVLACLYAYLTYRRWSLRFSFVCVTLLLTILVNGLRVYVIIMLTHLGDGNALARTVARTIDETWGHLIYGWLIFAAMMLILFRLGSRWREQSEVEATRTPIDGALRPAHTFRLLLVGAGAVALVALVSTTADRIAKQPAREVRLLQAPALPVDRPWMTLSGYTTEWRPHFAGADREVVESYALNDRQVHMYIAYYATQNQGAELISDSNFILDGERWVRLAEKRTRALIDRRAVNVHEVVMKTSPNSDRRRLVWTWFWVAGEFTSNPIYAKLLQAKARLVGGPQAAAAIAIATDETLDSNASEILQDFLRHMSVVGSLDRFSS